MGILHILLGIIIVIVIILALVGVGLILIPMKYSVLSKYDTSFKFEGEINFIYFIKISYSINTNSINIYIFGYKLITINKRTTNYKKNKKSKSGLEGKKSKFNNTVKSMIEGKLDSKLDKIKQLINTVKPNEINIFGEYGISDPGITGMISGLTYALNGFNMPIRIDLSPIFTHEVLNVNIEVKGQIRIASIFKLLLK